MLDKKKELCFPIVVSSISQKPCPELCFLHFLQFLQFSRVFFEWLPCSFFFCCKHQLWFCLVWFFMNDWVGVQRLRELCWRAVCAVWRDCISQTKIAWHCYCRAMLHFRRRWLLFFNWHYLECRSSAPWCNTISQNCSGTKRIHRTSAAFKLFWMR